jgi:hypothetical protein
MHVSVHVCVPCAYYFNPMSEPFLVPCAYYFNPMSEPFLVYTIVNHLVLLDLSNSVFTATLLIGLV